jgi:hypothetical protein
MVAQYEKKPYITIGEGLGGIVGWVIARVPRVQGRKMLVISRAADPVSVLVVVVVFQ